MIFGIKKRREKIYTLKLEIQEIEKFKYKYEEILRKIRRGKRFEFDSWFKDSSELKENLSDVHQEGLEAIISRGKKTTPERVIGTEGFIIQKEKEELVEKVEDTIDRFEKEKSSKIELMNKKRKSLKLIILSMLLTVWVLLAFSLYLLLF